jgi:hypothetical protein
MNSNVLDAWYNGINNTIYGASCVNIITNFMGHNLAIVVVGNLHFIRSYEINTNVIHLLVLFEYQCHVHCLDMNVICLFVLIKHGCYMSICVVYTRKSCTWLSCLNHAWHSCLNNTNPWNNKFRMNLKRMHEAYKFVMICWALKKAFPIFWMQICASIFFHYN